MEKNFLNVTKCMAIVAMMAVALELGFELGANNKIKGTTDEVAWIYNAESQKANQNLIVPPIRATEQMAKLKLEVSPKIEKVVFNSETQVQECGFLDFAKRFAEAVTEFFLG